MEECFLTRNSFVLMYNRRNFISSGDHNEAKREVAREFNVGTT